MARLTTPTRRYRLDVDAQLHGRVLVGGSPLRLFRLTGAGRRTVLAIGSPTPASRLTEALLDSGAIHPVPEAQPSGHRESDVSIVVPSLGPPPHPPPGALIVDDGTQPPVPGAAIRLDRNSGPAAARNAGLRRVTTPLVAFVDADVAVADGWLRPLLAHFDDPQVAVVAPRVVSRRGPSLLARYESHDSPLDLGDRPARVRPGSRVSYVPAAALVCRVDALRACGGFDESLRHGEDVDLVWRLDAAGWRVRYEPESVVTHAPRADWAGWLRQRAAYGSAAAPLGRRHPGAVAPLRMSGWSIAAWAAAVAGYPASGLALGLATALALVGRLPDLPRRVAFELAWRGNVRAGAQLAGAVRRTWWPLLGVVAIRSRSARRILALSAVAARHPVRLVDDAAYCVGVWRGMYAERTVEPLVPDISSWPGRRRRRPG